MLKMMMYRRGERIKIFGEGITSNQTNLLVEVSPLMVKLKGIFLS